MTDFEAALRERWNAPGARQSLLDDLCGLLRYPSEKAAPSGPTQPFGKDIDDALRFVLDVAEKLGFDVENIDGYAGVARWSTGKPGPVLGILGHLDVVPAGDGWTSPPYDPAFRDGYLYARGVSDNKGACISALHALRAVADLAEGCCGTDAPVLAGDVLVIFGTDEESGWADMDYLFSHRPDLMPDFGIVPDADYPLVYAEKGIAHIRVASVEGAPAHEPNTSLIKSVRGGVRPNVVPEECVCAFAEGLSADGIVQTMAQVQSTMGYDLKAAFDDKGSLIVTSRGKAAHGAQPHLGVNAIGQMLEFLSRVALPGTPSGEFLRLCARKLGMDYTGVEMGLAFTDESGPLTCNLGMIDVTPDHADVVLDIRYPVTMTLDQVLHTVREAFPSCAITPGHCQGPLYMPKDSAFVQNLLEIYRSLTGDFSPPLAIGGGTYARALKRAVAFGMEFPGEETHIHELDERCSVERLMLHTEIYAHAMVKLLSK